METAKVLFLEHGTATSIADIARESGVSKSGLLHHFPSKEMLIESIIKLAIEQFDAAVMERVDLTDPRPGKFLRGYVHALTSNEDRVITLLSHTGLISKFEITDKLHELYAQDSTKWRDRFLSDGLPLGILTVVRGAAESLAIDRDTVWVTDEEFYAGRDFLIELTLQTG